MDVRNREQGLLVSIVVVNYNGREYLRDCLNSVLAQTYRAFEVIVVDNGSTDGSAAMLRADFPEVRLLEERTNIGFAGANNRGVETARGEYVALLNNDTVVDPQWLSALVRGAETRVLDIAASVVVTDGVPPEHYLLNGTLNYLGYNIMEVFSDLTLTFYASGAALLFRRDAGDPLFLDEYFLYHEDVFFSWCCRLRGRKVGMVQESRVRHRGSVSVKRQPSSLISYYQIRNRYLNSLLLYQGRTLLLLLPYFAVDVAATVVLALFGRRHSFPGVMRAFFWPVTHLGWIRRQRAACQKTRSVPDREIMAWMSSDVVQGGGVIGRAANRLSGMYASLVGLARYE